MALDREVLIEILDRRPERGGEAPRCGNGRPLGFGRRMEPPHGFVYKFSKHF